MNMSDPTLRSKIFTETLMSSMKTGNNDCELLLALGKLWFAENPTESPSRVFAQTIKHTHSPNPPPLQEFIFWCAQMDGLQCAPISINTLFNALVDPLNHGRNHLHLPMAKAALTLAGSSWARSMGLLLNESSPSNAPLWPLFCSMTLIDFKELTKISQQTGPLEAQHAAARDDFLMMACETGHVPLFNMALKALPSINPSASCITKCCSALIRNKPHASARKEIGIEKAAVIDNYTMALRFANAYALPSLDRELLSGICISQMSLPSTLLSTPWKDTLVSLAARGSSQLDIDDLFNLVQKAGAYMVSISGGPDNRNYSYGSERFLQISGRDMNHAAFDDLAAACVKISLLPRSLKLSPESPPLAFRLLNILALAGPKTRTLAITAMDRWAKEGFGKEALAWHRSVSGHTQSIGSAIASLPQTGHASSGSTLCISSWLKALAAQGFNFEMKSTPKSKSLGERLRSSAKLTAFWPLVESHILATSTRVDVSSKRRPTL